MLLHRLELREMPVDLIVGVFPDGAGVHEHHVGAFAILGEFKSRFAEQGPDELRVVLVHLAAEGLDMYGMGLVRWCHSSVLWAGAAEGDVS